MVLGILQVELLIGDATSLKDKRRVLSSLKDRIGSEPFIAVAEVDRHESHRHAVLGIVAVSNDGRHARSVIDRVLDRLRSDPRIVLSDHTTEILTGH